MTVPAIELSRIAHPDNPFFPPVIYLLMVRVMVLAANPTIVTRTTISQRPKTTVVFLVFSLEKPIQAILSKTYTEYAEKTYLNNRAISI